MCNGVLICGDLGRLEFSVLCHLMLPIGDGLLDAADDWSLCRK
jgi:hypothetical protein